MIDLHTFVADLPDGTFEELFEACMPRLTAMKNAACNKPLWNGHLTSAEKFAMDQGRKITAIKSVRERLGLGLKEAKEFVEENYCPPLSNGRAPPHC